MNERERLERMMSEQLDGLRAELDNPKLNTKAMRGARNRMVRKLAIAAGAINILLREFEPAPHALADEIGRQPDLIGSTPSRPRPALHIVGGTDMERANGNAA